MTDKPDTTREAVERMLVALERPLWEGHGEESDLPEEASYLLRTLAAENDALRASLREVDEKLSCYRAQDQHMAAVNSQMQSEIDALRAQVAALRQAVERARGEALEEAAGIAEAPLRSLTYGGCRTAYEMVARAIRARAGGAGNE
jgi:uncharacterized protein YfaS (alpha-2-macroglobulin family)